MTTIKELADKYCEGSSFEDAVMEKSAFISGANHVLEEIGKVLNSDLNSHSKFKLLCIKQIIDELKGE